jgi:hypothetical protein
VIQGLNLGLCVQAFFYLFIYFVWYWSLNSGPQACMAGALSLEPPHQPKYTPSCPQIHDLPASFSSLH